MEQAMRKKQFRKQLDQALEALRRALTAPPPKPVIEYVYPKTASFVIDCVVLARPRLEPTFAIHGEAEPTPSDDPEDSLLKGEPSKERETHNGLFVETEHGVFARLERYAIIPVERFQELMEAEALYVERFGRETSE